MHVQWSVLVLGLLDGCTVAVRMYSGLEYSGGGRPASPFPLYIHPCTVQLTTGQLYSTCTYVQWTGIQYSGKAPTPPGAMGLEWAVPRLFRKREFSTRVEHGGYWLVAGGAISTKSVNTPNKSTKCLTFLP